MSEPALAETGEREHAGGYLAALGLIVVMTAGLLLFVAPGWLRGGERGIKSEQEGPLTAGDATEVSTARLPGDVLTFGHVAVFNTGDRPAVLDRVDFDPPLPENLELLGIQVAPDPDREFHTVGRADGYPPTGFDIGPLKALKGATVYPKHTREGERGVPLIMGFRFEGGDLASFRTVIVDYHVGARMYRAKLDKTFIVCSATTYPNGCPDGDEIYPSE